MAFSTIVADRISFGNKKMIALELTDVQSGGSSIKFGDTAWAVKAVNNTDSADTFKEAVGVHSNPTTRNQLTFTAGNDNDDGFACIIYN